MIKNERLRVKKKNKNHPPFFTPVSSMIQDSMAMEKRELKGEMKGQGGGKKSPDLARKSWLNVLWCVKLIAGKALANAAVNHNLYWTGPSTQQRCRKKKKIIHLFFPFAVYSSNLELYVNAHFFGSFWCLFCVTPCPDNCELPCGL